MIVTVAIPTSLAAVFLLLPLLLGVVAVVHLAATHPRRPPSTRQFLKTCGLGLGVLVGATLLFLAVDGRYGIEAALLLVILPAYLVYKVLVARDVLFAATTGLLIGAAIVSYLPPINLGPRNIVAYVAFFAMARRLMQYADDGGGEVLPTAARALGGRGLGRGAPHAPGGGLAVHAGHPWRRRGDEP